MCFLYKAFQMLFTDGTHTPTFRKFVKLYTSKISYNILAKNIYVRINQGKRVQFTAVKPFECYHCKLHTLELEKKKILFKKPYLSFPCFGRIFAAQQLIPVRCVFILLVLKSSSLFWFQFLSDPNYLNGSHTGLTTGSNFLGEIVVGLDMAPGTPQDGLLHIYENHEHYNFLALVCKTSV